MSRPRPCGLLALLFKLRTPYLAALAVALDMTFANRNRGGTHVYARSLFNSLRDRPDVVAWVISGPRKSNSARTLAWLVLGAGNAIRSKPPDILHCPAFVIPWRVTAPVVVTVHDAAARRYPRDHPLEWRLYDRRLMPQRLRAADRVITVSEFARKDVIDAYRLDPDRVVVVHNGIDPRFFISPRRDDAATGPLLFPGAPLGRKNLDVVLRCLAGAPKGSALSRVHLEISGAARLEYPRYDRLITSLGLESRVRWLGHVADMHAVIARAAAVVYPSLYEGFGLPPLEALAASTPVVASNRGSLPEVLGEAALQPDPEDDHAVAEAIESVLTSPDLRERMRHAGVARARLFTWERCAERTLDVYRAVLSEHHVAV